MYRMVAVETLSTYFNRDGKTSYWRQAILALGVHLSMTATTPRWSEAVLIGT